MDPRYPGLRGATLRATLGCRIGPLQGPETALRAALRGACFGATRVVFEVSEVPETFTQMSGALKLALSSWMMNWHH